MNMHSQLFTFALLVMLAGTPATAQTGNEHSGETSHASEEDQPQSQREPHDDSGHKGEDRHGEESNEEYPHQEKDQHAREQEEGGHDEGAQGIVELGSESQRIANIQTKQIDLQPIPEIITAPGEVQLNAYRSARVSTRIPAQVVSRMAKLGDVVEKDTPLVLLTSVDMAEAQGALQIAAREWERVRGLGKSVVGESRYIESRVAFEQAQSRLQAFGMTEIQVDRFLRGEDKLQLGQFRLLAPVEGTIIEDEFVVGQYVETGTTLFFITDESSVWVEATVQASDARAIDPGEPARVRIGKEWYQGKVVQKRHRLDESTRTMGVRIELELNTENLLHSGEFVEVAIEANQGEPGMLVPERALNRNSAGEWVLFVQEVPGKYRQVDVQRLKELSGKVEVAGVKPGTTVVTDGAFYLNSEIAKGSFSVHNH
ncbi:efflux RND transporter periplasmic adaptor subunit [Marinobacter sp. AC-23]|uniref:efflux RND transporter periplasmic adaptor subunit n=1 Tax=Marinobacter sp. AC-23 TaxID=1879031 RepID=UPI0009F5F744|nr:efflux RND transporter periplasmic adaptor subunit [Marinobacter sp. AC-23]